MNKVIETVTVDEIRILTSKKGRAFANVVFESSFSRYPLSLPLFENFENVKQGDELSLVMNHDRYFNAVLALVAE